MYAIEIVPHIARHAELVRNKLHAISTKLSRIGLPLSVRIRDLLFIKVAFWISHDIPEAEKTLDKDWLSRTQSMIKYNLHIFSLFSDRVAKRLAKLLAKKVLMYIAKKRVLNMMPIVQVIDADVINTLLLRANDLLKFRM